MKLCACLTHGIIVNFVGLISHWSGPRSIFSFQNRSENSLPGCVWFLCTAIFLALLPSDAYSDEVEDTTPPTAQISTTSISPTNARSAAFQVQFSEDVENFSAAAITVRQGRVVSVTQVSGSLYNFSVEPLSPSSVMSVRIDGNINITDLAGNFFTAPTNVIEIIFDLVRPTALIASTVHEVSNVSPVAFVVSFSERVSGMRLDDLVVTGGTAANFIGVSGTTYHFTVTPSGDGWVTVELPADSAFDAVGNGNILAGRFAFIHKASSPTVEISSTASPGPTSTSPIPVTVAFSDRVWVFDVGDVSVSGGLISNFAGSGSTYTFNLTPSGVGRVTVDVAASVAVDIVGNNNTAATQFAITYNGIPTANAGPDQTVTSGVTVTLDGSASTDAETPGSLTYAWTQTGGTAVGFSTPAAQPSFTAPTLNIGDADAVLTFSLTVDDGLNASVADTVVITVQAPADTIAPVIENSSPLAFEAAPSGTRSVNFSATVTDNLDPVVTTVFTLNGSVITSPFDFSIGSNSVVINAQDAAGNPAIQQTLTVMITPAVAPDTPVITTSVVNSDRSMTIAGTAEPGSTVRVTFPDAHFGTVMAASGSGAYSVTSPADMPGGTVTVTAADDLGNTSAAATVDLFPDYDAPTVEILGAPVSMNGVDPFAVTVEFSEDVLNFVSGDVTVANGSVTRFNPVDGNTYEVTITPTGAGEVMIEVASGVTNDAAGNLNEAAAPVTIGNTIIKDTQKVIASFMLNRANHILSNQPDLTGYLEGTISAGGGPLGYLGINGSEEGMDFAFSTSLSRIDRARTESLEQLATHPIADAHTNGADPSSRDLDRLLPPRRKLEQTNTLTLATQTYGTADSGTYGADLADGSEATPQTGYSDMPDRRYDIWTGIYGSTANTNDYDSSFWVGYLGAHYFLTPNVIIGGLVQFDWAEEKNDVTGSSVDGRGWMSGPYIAGRITGTQLRYEARASWGQSNNNVSPLGTYTDDFDTERWLAYFKLKGNYKPETVTFRPSVSVSYFEEEQKSYTDSLTNKIPSQTVSLGEVRFGPEFIKDIALVDGSLLQPSIGVSGVWNFGVDEGASSQGYTLGNNDLRGRVDAGFSLTNLNGTNISANAFYDGLGIDDYESMGGKVKLSIPIR